MPRETLALLAVTIVLPCAALAQMETKWPTKPVQWNVLPIAEAAVTGYEWAPWFVVFAPADTPADAEVKVDKVLVAAMRQPEILKKLESVGTAPMGLTPQALAEHLNNGLVRWSALIKERDIRLD